MGDPVKDLFIAICDALGIERLVKWLNNLLTGGGMSNRDLRHLLLVIAATLLLQGF